MEKEGREELIRVEPEEAGLDRCLPLSVSEKVTIWFSDSVFNLVLPLVNKVGNSRNAVYSGIDWQKGAYLLEESLSVKFG